MLRWARRAGRESGIRRRKGKMGDDSDSGASSWEIMLLVYYRTSRQRYLAVD